MTTSSKKSLQGRSIPFTPLYHNEIVTRNARKYKPLCSLRKVTLPFYNFGHTFEGMHLTHSISAWERVLTWRLQRQKKQVDVGIGLPLEHPVLSTGESERMPSVTNGKE